MSAPIVSIESIARHAGEAAASWKPRMPKPRNPYDEHLTPEHHRAWRECFEIALLQHSAPESEAAA